MRPTKLTPHFSRGQNHMKCHLSIGKIFRFQTATLALARAIWHDAVRRKMIQLGERLRQYRCPPAIAILWPRRYAWDERAKIITPR